MKFANLTPRPLILPKPGGGSVMIRPGETVVGKWWSRFKSKDQLTHVSETYVPKAPKRRVVKPPSRPSVSKPPKPRSAKPKFAIPTYSPAALRNLDPARALHEAKRLCGIGRRYGRTSPQHWKAGGELQKLLTVALPSKPLTVFKNKHKGKRAFIIGNGPSIDRMNLKPLAKEVTFACNLIYQHPKLTFQPTYYTANDRNVAVIMRTQTDGWLARCPQTIRFATRLSTVHKHVVPHIDVLRSLVGNPRVWFVNLRHQPWTQPCFSTDIARGICQNGTTIYYMIQLAFYMGCNPVYIIGVDCTSGRTAHGKGHFKAARYAKGIEKKPPPPPPTWKMIFSRYALARSVFERDHRKILNAGIGGKLDVFKRVRYGKLFK